MSDASSTIPDRLQAHEALEILLHAADAQERLNAADIVIRYGHALPSAPTHEFRWKSPWKVPRFFSGHAAGVGDVSLRTEERKRVEWRSSSYEQDRVGHFRLTKWPHGLLTFHHFWASDETTSGTDDVLYMPITHELAYDPETLAFKAFGTYEERERTDLDLWLFRRQMLRMELKVSLGDQTHTGKRVLVDYEFL